MMAYRTPDTGTFIGAPVGMWYDERRAVTLPNGMKFIYRFEWNSHGDDDCRKHGHSVVSEAGTVIDLGKPYRSTLYGQDLIDAIHEALARRLIHYPPF